MKVGFASDHRGFRLKHALIDFLKTKDVTVVDFGTYSEESCDYPDYAYILGRAVRDKRVERGILICYTGIGSAIAANKVKGVRAGLIWNMKTAQLSRRHNDANIAVLPSAVFTQTRAKKIAWKWLKTEFEGGRHLRRIKKIKHIEDKENV